MITLGIDLSSMPEGTAACRIDWQVDGAVAQQPFEGCDDKALDALICDADAIGIDAPFGWPEAFIAAVADWSSFTWNKETRNQLRFRETDKAARLQTKRWPLSVSSDRIALPAMRAMALLRRHGVTDRSGDGKFFEVYPAGSLSCWKLRCRGYKTVDEQCLGFRKEILSELRGRIPWLDVPEKYADSSDSLDALIASLTVRCAKQNRTFLPEPDQAAAAHREGWIHLPTELPKL